MKRVFTITVLVLMTAAVFAADSGTSSVHDITGLLTAADGWTDLRGMYQSPSGYNDSRIIYVSTSGNDSTAAAYSPGSPVIGDDPFHPAGVVAPYRTLSAAYERLRDGYPDIMLLKRGEVWTEDLPDWRKSGRSQSERMIISAYGSESLNRPKTGRCYKDKPISYLIFSSLELRTSDRALNWDGSCSYVLLEDIYAPPGLGSGFIIQDSSSADIGIRNLAIRRCVIAGRSRAPGSDTLVMGIYIDKADDLLLEENVFDKNGWALNNDSDESSYADLRNHNTYVMLGRTGTETHTWRRNISSRGRADGIQAGCGGLIEHNLCVQDAIAMSVSKSDTWWPHGFPATIRQNVILHGRDISSSDRRGWGISLTNLNKAVIDDNIIADNTDSAYPFGIYADPVSVPGFRCTSGI